MLEFYLIVLLEYLRTEITYLPKVAHINHKRHSVYTS